MSLAGSVLQTARLRLRTLDLADAPFVLRLVNEPSWLANIGDRGVRDIGDAKAYLRSGPLASYERHGFGLLAVERQDTGALAGLCGLLQREVLPHPDLGFALLPEHWRQGYAREAAAAVCAWARNTLRLPTLQAVVAPHNTASARLLARLGFRAQGQVRLAAEAPALDLYALDLSGRRGSAVP